MYRESLNLQDSEYVDYLNLENPLIQLIKEYEELEKIAVEEKLSEKKKFRTDIFDNKLFRKLALYIFVFMSVSIFKMIMLYKIVDLNIELEELNKSISEIERNISSAEYLTSTPEVNLSDIKKQSKKLGFTDKNDVAYVKFD